MFKKASLGSRDLSKDLEEVRRVNHVDIWGKSIPGRGKNEVQRPEGEECLYSSVGEDHLSQFLP